MISLRPIHLLSAPIKTRSSGVLQAAVLRPSLPFHPSQTQLVPSSTRTMSQRDVSKFSDISKSISEPDGSFNRKPSSFRSFIEKDGHFAPEKGALHAYACTPPVPTLVHQQAGTTSMSHTHAVSSLVFSLPRRVRRVFLLAWATRTLIVRKLKGLEDFIGAFARPAGRSTEWC